MSDIDRVVELHLPAACNGDRQAFAALVAATQNTVTSIALAIVRDVQYSEDIAQEAYLVVWKRLGSLRQNHSFLPWLRQVTRNLARDHLRRSRAHPYDRADGGDISELSNSLPGDHPDSEQALLDAEQDRLIAEALEALPDDSREVLTLFYREGESSRQVSRLLGLSDAAVRKRLSRARAALREEVAAKLGRNLAGTVPGAAFTTLVASLLLTTSPPAAAAVALGLGAKSGAKLLLGAGLGAAMGLIGGIAGVFLGLRQWLQTSTDPTERQALLRLRRIGVIATVLAVAGFTVSAYLPGWWPATVTFLLFLTAMGWQTMVMLPRILAARLARERERNPRAVAQQERRRRLIAWTGLVLGAVLGSAGLLTGLETTGRINWF